MNSGSRSLPDHRIRLWNQASKRWCIDVFGEQVCNFIKRFQWFPPSKGRVFLVSCSFERFRKNIQYWCRKILIIRFPVASKHQTWVGMTGPQKPTYQRPSRPEQVFSWKTTLQGPRWNISHPTLGKGTENHRLKYVPKRYGICHRYFPGIPRGFFRFKFRSRVLANVTRVGQTDAWKAKYANEVLLVGWWVGWSDGWMVGWLDGWMVGWLDGWLVGWMVGCGFLVCCCCCKRAFCLTVFSQD